MRERNFKYLTLIEVLTDCKNLYFGGSARQWFIAAGMNLKTGYQYLDKKTTYLPKPATISKLISPLPREAQARVTLAYLHYHLPPGFEKLLSISSPFLDSTDPLQPLPLTVPLSDKANISLACLREQAEEDQTTQDFLEMLFDLVFRKDVSDLEDPSPVAHSSSLGTDRHSLRG